MTFYRKYTVFLVLSTENTKNYPRSVFDIKSKHNLFYEAFVFDNDHYRLDFMTTCRSLNMCDVIKVSICQGVIATVKN
jgi:hypothetical protein